MNFGKFDILLFQEDILEVALSLFFIVIKERVKVTN